MAGLRWTHTEADAGDVDSSVAMMDNAMGQMHRTLRDRFNAADRSKTDGNLDFMFNWRHALNHGLSFEYGFGIKNRAPSHQERYLWLPLEATAGLADGKLYLGNLDLKPEQAMQFELAMNYAEESFSMTPHVFYHRINDYIQGVPNTVMPAPSGVLRYDNVGAELYGFDLEWQQQINDQWRLKNVTSYVRGKRRDINDHLYRIAPINTWFNLSYETGQWQLDTEVMAAMKQDKVSITNGEKATPGFGVLHLSVIRSINDNSNFKLAVNNVFDKLYYQHTNGYNRNNRNVDVGFDANNLQAFRLPSEGRSFSISYFYAW
jgi:iron complex outermembrane receptor protein